MRTLIVPFLTLFLSAQLSAQPTGSAPILKSYDDRETMLNDSVRQVERWNLKPERIVFRHWFIGSRPVGIWEDFDHKGRLQTTRDFGNVVYSTSTPPASDDGKKLMEGAKSNGSMSDSVASPVFTLVEQMPEFPGGQAAMYRFLGQQIKYPTEALDEGIMGVVYIVGIVDETGHWTTKEILRGAHPYLDYEAWRVCENMPMWTPGRQLGKAVKVQYNLPIRFTLR